MQAAGQRFVSWLYQHIEEDSIPGVVWVNKPQLVCQIPWQRGSRKSYSGGSLTKLLQAWAKYRGRSQEPDLRTCMKEVNYALQNLKGVLRTVKVDEVEGYRLLQFDRTALEKDVHVRLDDTDQSRIGSSDHQSDDTTNERREDNQVTSQEAQQRIPSTDVDEACEAAKSTRQPHGPPPLLNSPTHLQNRRNHTPSSAENVASNRISERSRSHSPHTPISEGCDPDPPVEYPVDLQPPVASLRAANSYAMEVIVFYFNKEVARHYVNNVSGCRLYYNPNPGQKYNIYGGPHVQIALPEPDIGFDTPSMKRLLQSMKLGLLIEMRDNDVYAKQLGLCSVYCNDTRYETTPEGRIRRFEGTKVYDYNQLFLSHFQSHCSGRGGCPSTELYLTFGQMWKCQRPAEENLLSVAVVHCQARSHVQGWSPHKPQKMADKPLDLEFYPLTDEDEKIKLHFASQLATR